MTSYFLVHCLFPYCHTTSGLFICKDKKSNMQHSDDLTGIIANIHAFFFPSVEQRAVGDRNISDTFKQT